MRITNLAVTREEKKDERVPVTAKVLNTIMEIRDSGETNMFDYQAVQYFADQRGCHSTVCWIQNNVKLYAQGINHGFKEIEEVTGE